MDFLENDKIRGEKLNNLVWDVLTKYGLEQIKEKSVQIICKDSLGKVIGLIYVNNLRKDSNCRLLKFEYIDGSASVLAYDYDSLLMYVDFLDKKTNYTYTKYMYPLEEIQKRIDSSSKHMASVDFSTYYKIFDEILKHLEDNKESILDCG